MSREAILIAVLIPVVGLGVNVLSSWLGRPPGLSGRNLFLIVVCLLGIVIGFGIALNGSAPATRTSPLPAPQPSPGAPRGVAALAPALVAGIVLSTDGSSGSDVLFSSRLDGLDRQRLWDGGGPLAVIPGTGDLLLTSDTHPTRAGLVIRTVTGSFVRDLTTPPPRHVDGSAAVAWRAGTAYFIRQRVIIIDASTSTFGRGELMRVPLTGRNAPVRVVTSHALQTVSASADGQVLAGACHLDDPGNVGQACLLDPRTGRMTHIPGSQGSTMSDVSVSPNGHLVAYSSFRANPYGGSQVFIYDIRTHSTTDLSQLPGINDQPSWIPSSSVPCLLFTHYTASQGHSVYLGCLTPAPATAQAIPVGQYPVWYGH